MGSRLSIAGLFSWAFPRENDDKQIPGPRAAAGTILRRTALQRKERAIAMELRRLRESPKRLLDNPRLWPHDREKWIGVQVLGQGAFGTASLWEFVGDGSPEDDANPLLGKLVVLKTGINHPSTVDLFEEGKIMKWLMKRNDSHLVRLVYNFDDSLFNKIYMEYCRFGDLAAEIRRRRSCKSPWSEKELWKMFYCLAKACQTMAKVEGGHNSLLHMDLKPHNILLCESGLDDHECPGGFIQYKIGDFGLAYEEKFPVFYARNWRPDGLARGTMMYKAPEQWFRGLYFSEKINVWGIGTIMYQAILLDSKPPPGPRPLVGLVRQKDSFDKFRSMFGANLIPALGKGDKYGMQLEDSAEANCYSDALIATVLHCLMHDPKYRSSSGELLQRVSKHIRNNYGLKDDEYEAIRDEARIIEQEKIRQAELKAAEEQARAATLAALIAAETKPQTMQMGQGGERRDLKQQERYLALKKKLEEESARARSEECENDPPPLWTQKMLTNDYDTTYWVNRKTGFGTWDDPYEDPPKSRTNMAGKVRPMVEISPLEQMWIEQWEEFQNDWRPVFKRSDTGEISYVEPEICREWREWHRAQWISILNDRNHEFNLPRPERQWPQERTKSLHNWFLGWVRGGGDA